MRLALLSDVHGNTIALDAVLADVEDAGGVDRFWVLGDLAALGPEPVEAVALLTDLPGVALTRGNTDRYVTAGDLPPSWLEDASRDAALVQHIVESAASFAWTRGMLQATGRLDVLTDLPLERRETLPDGTRLLGVHASPGRDDGDGIRPEQTDDELSTLLAGADADLVCTGHTHVFLDRTVGGTRIVNLGSVSLPHPDEPRASYAILDADEHGYRLEHRLVEYDHAAVRAAIASADPPGAAFLTGIFAG